MSGTTYDDFSARYATRANALTASEIRALFSVASRPEVVSLAGGMPYLAALPLDAVGDLLGDLVASRGASALQYASAQGDPGLREHICTVMALEGITASADDVVVTVGSQQGLDLVSRIFLDPGDGRQSRARLSGGRAILGVEERRAGERVDHNIKITHRPR